MVDVRERLEIRNTTRVEGPLAWVCGARWWLRESPTVFRSRPPAWWPEPSVSEPSPFLYEHAEESPGLQLWKLTKLWQNGAVTALQPFGLTQTQYAILASLRWFEEHDLQPTQRHLGDHANIDKMTLSKAIRRLEAAGLVTRRGASHDARATEIGFTARGRRTIAKAVVAVESADETFFARLDPDRLQTRLRLTSELIGQQAVSDPAPASRT